MDRGGPEFGLRTKQHRLEAVEVTLRAGDVDLITKLADILAGDDLESERLRDLIQEVLSRPDGVNAVAERCEDDLLH